MTDSIPPTKRYRGFSTSISSLFAEESIVCAASSCFGIMLSQRTEFLLNVRNERRGGKKRNPSQVVAISFLVSVVLVTLTYVIWGFESEGANNAVNNYNYDDDYAYDGNRELTTTLMYQLDGARPTLMSTFNFIHNNILSIDNSNSNRRYLNSTSTSNLGELCRAILCTSFLLLLGIVGRRRRMRTRYALIRARAQDDYLLQLPSSNSKLITREDKYEGACSHTLCGCYPADGPELEEYVDPEDEYCIPRAYKCLNATCCGTVCKCWIQCLSMCALAQEARETALLIPRRFQRVDYITHQSFGEYHEAMLAIRRQQNEYDYNPGICAYWRSLSKLSQYILLLFLLCAILVTASLIITPQSSFGIGNGFVLAATFLESFLLLYVMHWLFHKSDLSLDAVIKLFAAGFLIATPTAFILEAVFLILATFFVYLFNGFFNMIRLDVVIYFFTQHQSIFWVIAELLNAFILAAATEELCKYYTFRMVEHPDLLFVSTMEDKTEEDALKTWSMKYPIMDRAGSFDSEATPYSLDGSVLRDSSHYKMNKSDQREVLRALHQMRDGAGRPEDIRNVRQMAAAVGVAMVSTAVGLACAENFIYVFFMRGLDVKQQALTLALRSIFPVHALCAAMQSIGVIRRFVEGQKEVGMVKIVLPAVILHGCFDAILLLLNLYVDYSGVSYTNFFVNMIGFLLVMTVLFFGFLWYWEARRLQKLRLIDMIDEDNERRRDLLRNEKDRGKSAKHHRILSEDTIPTRNYKKKSSYVSPNLPTLQEPENSETDGRSRTANRTVGSTSKSSSNEETETAEQTKTKSRSEKTTINESGSSNRRSKSRQSTSTSTSSARSETKKQNVPSDAKRTSSSRQRGRSKEPSSVPKQSSARKSSKTRSVQGEDKRQRSRSSRRSSSQSRS